MLILLAKSLWEVLRPLRCFHFIPHLFGFSPFRWWIAVLPSTRFPLSVDKVTKVSKLSWVRGICALNAFCLFIIRNFKLSFIHGTTAAHILTYLAGMMILRPECVTSWKTCHFSSQLIRGMNNRDQFICIRYLHNAALLQTIRCYQKQLRKRLRTHWFDHADERPLNRGRANVGNENHNNTSCNWSPGTCKEIEIFQVT